MKQLLTILLLLCFAGASGQNRAEQQNTILLHRAQQALTDVIVHDIFSPPVASRVYVYPNIAAYEVLAKGQQKYPPLHDLRGSFPAMPFPQEGANIDYQVAAVYAFMNTAKHFVFSESMIADSLELIMKELARTLPDKKRRLRSLEYGRQISDSVIAWSNGDQYRQTRSLRRYSYSKKEGAWKPTPPGYFAAVEPYWSRMRLFMLDSVKQFLPVPPSDYSTDSSSHFYKAAMEVYLTGKNLSDEERDIALFWDCNPFFLNTSGHLVFATKKLSPGGHWMSVAGIASRKINAGMMETSLAYTMTAIALYDAFISCWDEKYRSNYIRPETFINAHIDESWRPLLQTPPFPEYISGHSVISNAAAVVLTSLLGPDFSFDDSTEVPYGLPVRSFGSFWEAADEATISRLYGGIHFREAIVNGQTQGLKIGEFIVKQMENSKMASVLR